MTEHEEQGLSVPESALSIDTIKRYAQAFVASGLFKLAPNGTQASAQAFVKVQAGQELGIPPFASMRGINIIEGKPELSAGLMATLIKRSERYRYDFAEINDARCILDFFERDDNGAWRKLTIGKAADAASFSIEDALRMQLVDRIENGKPIARSQKGNPLAWEKSPSDMLFARALSRGFRRFTPELTAGGTYYVEGEVSGLEPEPAPTGPHGAEIIDLDVETGEIIEQTAPQTLPIQEPARSIEDVPLPEPQGLQITDDQRDDLIRSADRKGIDLGSWLLEHSVEGPLSQVPSERASELLKEIHALPDPAQESLPVDENGWAKDEPKSAAKEKKKAGAK